MLALAVFAATVLARPALVLFAQDAPQEFVLRVPDDRIEAVAARYGLTIVRPVDEHGHGVYLVRKPAPGGEVPPFSGANTPSAGDSSDATQVFLGTVRTDPDVLDFDPNHHAKISETHPGAQLNESTVAILDSLANPSLANFYGVNVWNYYVGQPASQVFHLTQAQQLATGAGTIVAIIDTGVDPHHAILAGALVAGYDFTRDSPGTGSEWPDLDESTVAILDRASGSILDPHAPVTLNESTVAILDSATAAQIDVSNLPPAFGHGTMVAGLVHLVAPAAKIMPLKAFRADGTSNMFDIERAIYYAVDHGAKVINMSFSVEAASGELTQAIDYATQHGVICLGSVGNSGRSALVFPAAFRNVLGIASTTNTDQRSIFSNFGDHLVRFAAPGEALVTLYPGQRYASVSGTSFSTALASGASSLMAQLEPAADQRLIGRYLDDNAVKLPDLGLGEGRIDLFTTLQHHSSTPTPPPPPPTDTVAPTVTMSYPATGATLTGLIPIAAAASDDVGVVGVQFMVDGVPVGAEATSAPYQLNWNTVAVANGVHAVTAIARDAAGNQQAAVPVSVTVTNDTSPPTVTMTSPAASGIVAGAIVLGASASDDVGVASVQFAVDGIALGAPHTGSPYAAEWDSRTVPNGVHALSATARDAAGNQQTATVSVTVANDTTPPTVSLTSPAANTVVTGTIAIGASASDDVGVVSVQFAVDGVNLGGERTAAPYVVEWNSGTAPNGVHVLSAAARDAAGNQQTATVSVTVANDATPPTVSLTSPAANAVVTGTIAFAAVAADDHGVAGVQFAVDGINFGAEQTTAPYRASWDSATVPNGAHVLTATARDAAGNQQTATVVVSVANDTTPPDISLTTPSADAVVTGTIAFGALASDDVGVAGVQFAIDGVNLGSEVGADPFATTWNTSTVPNGAHVLTATARDAAGNQRTASVTVVVANDTTPPEVTIVNPVDSGTVGGTVTLAADATDDVAVVGLQFTIDGVNFGDEIASAPFEVQWDTTTAGDGTHVVAAIARDAANNQRIGAGVTVTVAQTGSSPQP